MRIQVPVTGSFRMIEKAQKEWGGRIERDPARPMYAVSIEANLCLEALGPKTKAEFDDADGAELVGTPDRPAKMRALISSSAFAVNFFDAWRGGQLDVLGDALGTSGSGGTLRFEYKPARYPVSPRSPNLDVLVTLGDGHRVAIESKFAEPFRSPGSDAPLSPKYFPEGPGLWAGAGLSRAQQLAGQLAARWVYLDAAQLLKHMLGLASDGEAPATLFYLWYDTGLEDAHAHRREVEMFAEAVHGDRVTFRSASYQEVFAALPAGAEPVAGWRQYMTERYFTTTG